VPLRNVEQNKGGQPSSEKDFETQHSGVFAPPGLPLAHFQLRNPGSNRFPSFKPFNRFLNSPLPRAVECCEIRLPVRFTRSR
jgi:hypothetical protein